jgi:Fic family protein
MLYWPAFDFSYTLDMARLLPHIAAIEAHQAAASVRVRPPQWRERPMSDEVEAQVLAAAAGQEAVTAEIQVRKQRVLFTNTSRALAWVRQRFIPGSAPLSIKEVCHMHCMAAEESGIRYETPGQMRQVGLKVVVGTPRIGFHVGAPAARVPGLMQQYVRLIAGETLLSMPPVVHALVGHFFFTTIHPFEDGNGRTSRLIAAAILFQRGYGGHGFHALFNYFYQNEERYHTILLQTQQKSCPDLTAFLAFGMEGLVEELQGINNFLKIKLHATLDGPRVPGFRRRLESRRERLRDAQPHVC